MCKLISSILVWVTPALAMGLLFCINEVKADPPAATQPVPTADQVFVALDKATQKLQASAANAPDIQVNATAARQQFKQLHDAWKAAGEPDIDPAYVKSLQLDAHSITRAADKPRDVQSVKLAERSATDLKAKATFANAGAGATGQLPSTLVVRVRTRRGQSYVNGYTVGCNPALADGDHSHPQFPFNDPTDQAKRNLPPGYYYIWIKLDNKEVDSKLVEIGSTGHSQEDVTFEVR